MKKKDYIFNTEKEREEAELALYDKIDEIDKKYDSNVKKLFIGLFSLLASSLFWIAMPMAIPSFVASVVGKILVALPFAACSIVNIVFVAKMVRNYRKLLKYSDEYLAVKNNAVVLEEENNNEVKEKELNRKDEKSLVKQEKLEAIKNLKKQIQKNNANKKAKVENKAKKNTSEEKQENVQTM